MNTFEKIFIKRTLFKAPEKEGIYVFKAEEFIMFSKTRKLF